MVTTVGILGAGRMGTGLATLLHDAGREVTLGSRTPHDPRFASQPFPTVTLEAASRSDVLVVTLPHDAIGLNLGLLRSIAPGTLVIDCANAVAIEQGRIRSALGLTHGRWLARQLPHLRVARAFSHIQDELLVSRATRQPDTWAVAVAADDAEALEETSELVRATRYLPVGVGGLDDSRVLDPGGVLFPNMFLPGDLRELLLRAAVQSG